MHVYVSVYMSAYMYYVCISIPVGETKCSLGMCVHTWPCYTCTMWPLPTPPNKCITHLLFAVPSGNPHRQSETAPPIWATLLHLHVAFPHFECHHWLQPAVRIDLDNPRGAIRDFIVQEPVQKEISTQFKSFLRNFRDDKDDLVYKDRLRDMCTSKLLTY